MSEFSKRAQEDDAALKKNIQGVNELANAMLKSAAAREKDGDAAEKRVKKIKRAVTDEEEITKKLLRETDSLTDALEKLSARSHNWILNNKENTKQFKLAAEGIMTYSEAIAVAEENVKNLQKEMSAFSKLPKNALGQRVKKHSNGEVSIYNDQMSEMFLDDYKKKIETAKKDVATLKREYTKYRKEAREQDKKAEAESTKSTEKQVKNLDKVIKKVEELKDVMSKLAQTVTKGSELNVRINNAGFTRVLNEMANAVDRFHERAGNEGKNLFDTQMFARNSTPTEQQLLPTAENIKDTIANLFNSKGVQGNISESVSEAIRKGVVNGIMLGTSTGMASIGDAASMNNLKQLVGSLKEAGATPQTMQHAITEMMRLGNLSGEQQFDLAKQDIQSRARNDKAVELAKVAEETKRKENELTHKQAMKNIELEYEARMAKDELEAQHRNMMQKLERSGMLPEVGEAWASFEIDKTKIERLILEDRAKQESLKTLKYQMDVDNAKEDLSKKRAWSSRKEAVAQDFRATDIQMEEMMLRYQGRELSNLDKALLKMTQLLGIRRDLEDKEEDGVRITSSQIKNWEDLAAQVRVIAKEQYKVEVGYEGQNKALKKSLELTQSYDQKLQAIGNLVSGIVRTWNTISGAVNNIFGRIRNNIVQLFYAGRNQVRSLVADATDQYSKLESSQVGFRNFFGEERSKTLIKEIQKEAIASPGVSSGDLSDYVAQLAPVSGGNADVALNATLGVLKAIKYSGGDASTEMSRVITNIRDVVSKGSATTIDIRQFNRAMPAIEQALEKMGASEFLSNGQLKITKENAKTLVQAFASLNTDEGSPVKNIFNQLGNTMDALKEAFDERKTQAMMNILQGSGAFDMAKGILSEVNEGGIIGKLEGFFTEKLKNIVDFLKTVDWDRLGTELQNGWKKITDLFKEGGEVYNIIKSVAPEGVDGWKVIEVIFNAIKNLIVGFANGAATVVNVFKNLTSGFRPDVVEKAATAMGFLVSPISKMFSAIGSVATSVLSASQNLNKTMSKFTESRIRKYDQFVERTAETIANTAGSTNNLMEYYKQYDSLTLQKDGTYIGYNKVRTPYTTENGETAYMTKTVATKPMVITPQGMVNASEYKKLNLSQRADTYYGGSRLKAAWASADRGYQKVMNSFISQVNTLVMGGQFLALGTALQAATSETDTFGRVVTEVVKALGTTMMLKSAGGFIGGLFGNSGIGSMIGGILGAVVGVASTIKTWYEAEQKRIAEEKAEKVRELRKQANDKGVQGVLDYLKAGGYDVDAPTIDADGNIVNGGSKSQTYAYEKLVERVAGMSIDELANVDVQRELAAYYAREQHKYEVADEYAKLDNDSNKDSEFYQKLHAATGGTKIDLNAEENRDKRAKLEEYVRKYKLLGESFNYDRASAEEIIEQFTSDFPEGITEEQYNLLVGTFGDLEDEIGESTTKLANKINDLSQTDEKLKKALEDNTKALYDLGFAMGYIGGSTDNPADANSEAYKAGQEAAHQAPIGSISNIGPVQQQSTLPSGFGTDPLTGNSINNLGNNGIASDKTGNWGQHGLQDDINKVIDAWNTHLAQAKNSNNYALASFLTTFKKETLDQLIAMTGTKAELEKALEEAKRKYEREIPNMTYYFKAAGGILSPIYRAMGGRGVDTVPAFLQPGEFIMRRGSVMKAGLGVMDALNRGDLATAARSLGSRLITGGQFNNSKNWSNVTNNNQRTNHNVFNIVNRNTSARMNTYSHLANQIATA